MPKTHTYVSYPGAISHILKSNILKYEWREDMMTMLCGYYHYAPLAKVLAVDAFLPDEMPGLCRRCSHIAMREIELDEARDRLIS